MRRNILAAIAVLLVATLAVPAFAARGRPTLHCFQYGVEALQLEAGTVFEIRGENFREWSPAIVLIRPGLVVKSDVDSDGNFSQLRSLAYPGPYTIEVYQWKSRQGGNSELVASMPITVVQP